MFKSGGWPWLGDEINLHIREGDFDLFEPATKFEFEEEVSQPVKVITNVHTTLSIQNKFGGVEVFSHDRPEISVKLKKKIAASDEA